MTAGSLTARAGGRPLAGGGVGVEAARGTVIVAPRLKPGPGISTASSPGAEKTSVRADAIDHEVLVRSDGPLGKHDIQAYQRELLLKFAEQVRHERGRPRGRDSYSDMTFDMLRHPAHARD